MRDSLNDFEHPFEWNGDHIYTNYVQMHQRLVEFGDYHVEILTEPFTCFDAENYGALLVVDPEDYFSGAEITKLRRDIEQLDLSLIVLADWYSQPLLEQSSFYNNNTFEVWHPVMAGSNVRTLNALLEPYNIALGDQRVLSGDFVLDKRKVVIDSGSEIVQFPQGGYLISADLHEEPQSVAARLNQSDPAQSNARNLSGSKEIEPGRDASTTDQLGPLTPTIGILTELNSANSRPSKAKIIIMSDSDCIDSNSNYYKSAADAHKNASNGIVQKCFWLMHMFADIATQKSGSYDSLLAERYRLPKDFLAAHYTGQGAINTETLEEHRAEAEKAQSGGKFSEFDRSIRLNSDDQTCRNKA